MTTETCPPNILNISSTFSHIFPNTIHPHFHCHSHPKAELSTSSASRNPLAGWVEDGHSWNSRDTVSTELRQLGPVRTVDVDEAVHVPYDQLLNIVMGETLPLWFETV